MLSFERAKVLAEEAAESYFSRLVETRPSSWTRAKCFEEKNCWLFLKREDLHFKTGAARHADAAIVVSKNGNVMTVADLREDEQALIEFLKKASEHLETMDK